MSEVVELINTCGFPIGAFLLMFWYMNTTVKTLTETITQNNMVMQKIVTILNVEEDDIK